MPLFQNHRAGWVDGITGGAKDKRTSVPALLLETARSAQTLPGGGGENLTTFA